MPGKSSSINTFTSGPKASHRYALSEPIRTMKKRIVALEKELAVHCKREKELGRLAVVVKDSNDAITLLNLDGQITAWNYGAERMYGYSEAEALAMNIVQIVPEDLRDEANSFLNSIKNGEAITSFETKRLTKEGKLLDVWLTITPIYDAAQNVTAIATTERDITERNLLEQRLKDSTQAIKIFSCSLMHDLLSPIVAIRGLSQRIQEKFSSLSNEKIASYCAQIHRTSKNLVDLIENINLYFSEKEMPLLVEKVSLSELLETIREEFSPKLDTRDVKLVEQDKLPAILADRIALLRVLRNLVDNALKYGGEDLSKIEIGHKETGEYHIFSVRDNGIGFSKDEAEKLFKPFQQKKTDVGRSGGLGLGLSIVREIAKHHSGEVWTEHNAEKGVTLCFSVSKSLVR